MSTRKVTLHVPIDMHKFINELAKKNNSTQGAEVIGIIKERMKAKPNATLEDVSKMTEVQYKRNRDRILKTLLKT